MPRLKQLFKLCSPEVENTGGAVESKASEIAEIVENAIEKIEQQEKQEELTNNVEDLQNTVENLLDNRKWDNEERWQQYNKIQNLETQNQALTEQVTALTLGMTAVLAKLETLETISQNNQNSGQNQSNADAVDPPKTEPAPVVEIPAEVDKKPVERKRKFI